MSSKRIANSLPVHDREQTSKAANGTDWVAHRLEVSHRRLLESTSQADALEVIREIVTGLLGCEEIALFSLHGGRSALLWSFGIDADQYQDLDVFDQSAVQHAREGTCNLQTLERDSCEGKSRFPIFIPILLDGRAAAVLVMFRLLPHKLVLDHSDVKLISLLSSEAGKALFNERSYPQARSAGSNG